MKSRLRNAKFIAAKAKLKKEIPAAMNISYGKQGNFEGYFYNTADQEEKIFYKVLSL